METKSIMIVGVGGQGTLLTQDMMLSFQKFTVWHSVAVP